MMKPAEIPLDVHFDEAFSAVNDILEESGIYVVRQTRIADVLIQYHASGCYSVVGLLPGHPAMPANLRQQISIKSALSSRKLKRDVIVAGVDRFFQPVDFALLSARFGAEFDRFLLLNDVALEACSDCNCNFNFVGAIPQASLVNPGILLTCPYWR